MGNLTPGREYGQTQKIKKRYSQGNWLTDIGGANQGAVMNALEAILQNDRPDLLGKLLILPISTMDGYRDPMPPQDWIKAHPGIVQQDLVDIENFILEGSVVFGWQNQTTTGTDSP